jgi:hypothetical protein
MISPLTAETLQSPPLGEVSPALGRLRSALPEAFRSRLRSARELSRSLREEEEEHPPLPTAVPSLDRLLEGGLPRGHLVELVGGRSSGRFSALLAALAAATGIGEPAGLVDLGDGLDPAAATALGADLERLLWLRPTTLQQAVAAAEMLLGAGFPLVALDLGNPPVRGGRGVEAVWLRLARAARSYGAALLVGSPYRVSGTAASVVIKAERSRAVWQGGEGAPWLLEGVSSRLALEKHRGRLPEGKSEGLELTVVESPLPAQPAQPARKPLTPVSSPTPSLRPGEGRHRPSREVWEMPLRAAGGRR